jgi:hypothetical protein
MLTHTICHYCYYYCCCYCCYYDHDCCHQTVVMTQMTAATTLTWSMHQHSLRESAIKMKTVMRTRHCGESQSDPEMLQLLVLLELRLSKLRCVCSCAHSKVYYVHYN